MYSENRSPFQQWLDENFKGVIASQEIMTYLAKAFEGGRLYEQEDCAKVCEQFGDWADEAYQESDSEFNAGECNGAYGCAHHIRRRKF